LLLLTYWHVSCACVCVSAPCVYRITHVIGPRAIERRYVQKMLVVLRGFWGRVLKADGTLFKMTVKLKAHSPDS
jgi:hypothetical protein